MAVSAASDPAVDPVEAILAKALEEAVAAREWGLVAQLSANLKDVRVARLAPVSAAPPVAPAAVDDGEDEDGSAAEERPN